MPQRSMLTILALALAFAAALSTGVSPAYAHAIIVRSEPLDGAVLSGPPQRVQLWFSEPVALEFTTVDLVDANGQRVAVEGIHTNAASLAMAVRTEQTSTTQMVIDLPSLPPSVYRLSWSTLSNGDLHTTSGMIVFGVQHDISGAAATVPETLPSPIEVALRWLNLGAIAALLGALALALLALPHVLRAPSAARIDPALAARTRQRLLALAEWSGMAALVAALALLLAQALAVGGSLTAGLVSAWEIMSGTRYGLAWLFGQAALMLLVARIILYRQRIRKLDTHFSAWFALPAVVLALAIACAQALQSHIASGSDAAPLRVAASSVHILAASIWSGGLLALSAAIVPLLGAGAEPQALAWALLRRFGALAAGSLAALLVSGLFMSGQQVASIDAALTTLYGRALLLKLGLVGVVALIGLCNAATLHPRVAAALRRPFARYRAAPAACMAEAPSIQGRLARWARLETIGAAAVLLLAALLTAAQPARGPAFDPPAPETPGVALTQADDLVMTLALKPNRPGQNFVSLNVIDTRRPAPAPIAEVAVQFQSPGAQEISRLVARPIGTGRYEVTDDSIVGSGDMPIHVTVRRAGLPDVNATLPWTVLPAGDRPRPVLVSNQPLAPALSLAALLIGLLVIAALAATRLRGSIVGSARALAGEFAPARRSAPPPERPTPAEERVAQ